MDNGKKVLCSGRAGGFSLVEILVGMAVGVVTIVVIMQSFASFEGQKRTTTSSSDALENGLIALQAIESDARSAGYGLVTPKGLACTSMFYYEQGLVDLGTVATVSIAPVTVVDGGASGSDMLTFTAATSPIAGMPSKLNADMSTAKSDAEIDNSVGFTVDRDLYLVAQPINSPGTGVTALPCARMAYTELCTNGNGVEIACAGKTFLSAGSPVAKFNTSSASYFPAGGYPMNSSYVINIGSGLNGGAGFVRSRYAVSGSDLMQADVSHMIAQNSVAIASNIVNMQVQYGVAPVNTAPGVSSPAVNCWTNASGNGCSAEQTWDAPSAADIMRIKAIRIALVARSSLPEKPSTAGGSCDATPSTGVQSWSGGPTIDLSADANWRCYRYRVYQTVIPLRNVIWANI